MNSDNLLAPFHVFRFQVDFRQGAPDSAESEDVVLCSGGFAECSGLEATMEPKVIKEGGRNDGVIQRAGPVTHATTVLKRGMTSNCDLWQWFELVSGGAYARRCTAVITMFDNAGTGVLGWQLERALPIKFKAADLNARGTEVGVEELHLAHEGLRLVDSRDGLGSLFTRGQESAS